MKKQIVLTRAGVALIPSALLGVIMPFRKLILILLSLACFAVGAADVPQEQDNPPEARLEIVSPEIELTEAQTQELIHRSHEIIEGDESGGFFRRWVNAFNLRTRAVDAIRWASATNRTGNHNLVVDSLFLFGLSHLTEMSTGPLLLSMGAAQDWPGWLMGVIAAGGTTISIPGLDPLCILIFTVYAKHPGFRNVVGTVRLATVKALTVTSSTLGITSLFHRLFGKRDVRAWLKSVEGLQFIEADEDGSANFHFTLRVGEVPAVSFMVRYDGELAYLSEVTLYPQMSGLISSRELGRLMRPFGWNATDLVVQASRLLASGQPMIKPYIVQSEQVADSVHYSLSPYAIGIRGGKAPTATEQACVEELETE